MAVTIEDEIASDPLVSMYSTTPRSGGGVEVTSVSDSLTKKEVGLDVALDGSLVGISVSPSAGSSIDSTVPLVERDDLSVGLAEGMSLGYWVGYSEGV